MKMFEFIEDEALRTKAEEAYDASVKEVNEGIQAKIDEAVSGLKTKNEVILGEKKKLQELTDAFKDIDPVKAREALKLINENEYAQLIKDGKIEEVIEKRSSAATSALKKTIDQLNATLESVSEEGTVYKTKYQRKVVDDEVREAAIKLGVRPEALNDVLLHGASVFKLADDGQVEARDPAGNLLKNKDNLVVTPSVWVEGLKDKAPHYWPPSEGAGLGGSSHSTDSEFATQADSLLAKGDVAGYRKLREKQRNAA